MKKFNTWENIPKNYDDYIGFVYEIFERNTGMKYIGKTSFWYIEKKKPTKYVLENGKYKKDNKGKRILNTRTTKKHIKKETDWKNYNSSSNLLKQKIEKNPQNYRKKIISCHKSQASLKAHEAYLQLKAYVKGDWKNYYNEMINLRIRLK